MYIKDHLALQGNAAMEDRIGFGPDYLFVIDGASGLDKVHLTDEASDAAWLAIRIGELLEMNLPDPSFELSDLMKAIAQALRQEYDNLSFSYQVAADYPSAGLAIVRRRYNQLEYFGLGDCTAVFRLTDGTFDLQREEALAALDQTAISEMVRQAEEHHCTVLEARPYIQDVLVENRNLRNKEGGYWIFDPTGIGIPHCRYFSRPINEVASVTLMTDGFAQLADTFTEADGFEDLHQRCLKEGLAPLADRLFALQEEDDQCNRYPRFKMRDDTCAVTAIITE
ncbi:MAG: protein phosphatase 2C domain-containing protein [Firmicutes bacterium]|nr:protein phosphatase 2C domain-containing protein [Bacillota bacterium]